MFHGKVHSIVPGRVYGHEGRKCDMENKITRNDRDALILKSGKPGVGEQAIL